MASVYETAVSVISKPPAKRTEAEIRSLIFWFRKKSDIFRQLTTDVVTDIVRNCDFLTRQKDDIVIRQGEKGDCFYIILRGIVSIYINTDLAADEDDITKSEAEPEQLLKETGELDRSKFGNYIAKLEAGYSFGELALINKNCIRNASIISDETTDLLVVNRELYNRSLKAAQTAELEQRNEFVRSHTLFNNWSFRHRKQMSYSLKKEKIQFNEHIVKQGLTANVLYFLLGGQAKILIEPLQHESQYPQFYPLQDPEDIMIQEAMYMNDGLPVRQLKKEVPAESLPENQLTVPPSALRKKDKAKKIVEVSVVAGSEIIGDIEFSLDLKSYLQSVSCTQECEVYSLDLKNYERLVTKRNPKSADILRQIAEVKLTSRLERLHDKQVPLMRTLLFKMDRMDIERNKWKFAARNVTNNTADNLFSTPRKKKDKLKPLSKNYSYPAVSYSNGGGAAPFSFGMLTLRGHSHRQSLDTARKSISDASYDGKDQVDSALPLKGKSKRGNKSDDLAISDLKLTMLEEKIKGWHTAILEDKQQKPGRNETLAAVKLRRYAPQKGKFIFPSSKVVIKRKRVQFNNMNDDLEDNGDLIDSWPKNHNEQELPPIYSGGISETKTALTEPGKTNAWLYRDILTSTALLSPLHAKIKSHAFISKTNVDDESGTILDVMRRTQEYMRSRTEAINVFSTRKQNIQRRQSSYQFPVGPRSLTLPLIGKSPNIVSDDDEHSNEIKRKHSDFDEKRSCFVLSTFADDKRFYKTLLNIREDPISGI